MGEWQPIETAPEENKGDRVMDKQEISPEVATRRITKTANRARQESGSKGAAVCLIAGVCLSIELGLSRDEVVQFVKENYDASKGGMMEVFGHDVFAR